MMSGWIKLHRAVIDNPRSSNPEWFSIWLHLLLLATHKPIKMVFGKDVIELKPGQLITSRNSLSKKTGVHRSTVDRILNIMKIEQQIEQVSSSVSRLITIVNWNDYQASEPPFEPQASHERATGEPRASTNKNRRIKECKNVPPTEGVLFPPNLQFDVEPPRNPSGELRATAVMLLTFLNDQAKRRFEMRDEMLKPIMKRLSEGNPPEEIKKMITREILEQGAGSKWLQPTTLFGKNFYGRYSDRDLPINIANGYHSNQQSTNHHRPTVSDQRNAAIIGSDRVRADLKTKGDADDLPFLPG
jgi:uncharacterized phage protein (TIGR02220 family)